MAHYSYHNRLKQLLKEHADTYICIPESGTFSFRFVFPTIGKSYPIRAHRIEEYMPYLCKVEVIM